MYDGDETCNPGYENAVYRGAVRTIPIVVALLLASCNRGTPPLLISPPAGDVAGEISWSSDKRCAVFLLSNKDGHSPMTTTRVAIAEPGVEGYRELRLPRPNERFSTVFDRWEGPGVVRLHGTTLDGEVEARYDCSSRKLEIVK